MVGDEARATIEKYRTPSPTIVVLCSVLRQEEHRSANTRHALCSSVVSVTDKSRIPTSLHTAVSPHCALIQSHSCEEMNGAILRESRRHQVQRSRRTHSCLSARRDKWQQ